MSKMDEVKEVALKLKMLGMDYKLAFKNLLQCDMYFIDKINRILK